MKKLLILFSIIIIVGIFYFGARYWPFQETPSSLTVSKSPTPTLTPTNALTLPIAQFKERITKKPFGIYITPQNSPVQPERFTGYHTGVDVEYQDASADVPVYALADGTIVLSKTASGYGGVLMLEFDLPAGEAGIAGTKHAALYGHLRPSSLLQVGTKVYQGEQLAVLGTPYSAETDGERRHLHFAILADNRLNIRGYVQSQNELSGWLDPLEFY